MSQFTGTIKLTLIEAKDLKPTNLSTRHGNVITKALDPYVSIDVDDIHINRSTTKQKTCQPCWNEQFYTEVYNAQSLLLTVFHNAALPPDDFVANCTIIFDDLVNRKNKNDQDFWVSSKFFLSYYK